MCLTPLIDLKTGEGRKLPAICTSATGERSTLGIENIIWEYGTGRWVNIVNLTHPGKNFETMEKGRGNYKGMQFGSAVKEPQVCSGVRVGDNVTPLLTQVLPDLFSCYVS